MSKNVGKKVVIGGLVVTLIGGLLCLANKVINKNNGDSQADVVTDDVEFCEEDVELTEEDVD